MMSLSRASTSAGILGLTLSALLALGCAGLSRPEYRSILQSDRAPVRGQAQVFFDWPVDRARMTRGFFDTGSRRHLGLDLAAPRGTPILASHDGKVIYTGQDFRGFGKLVMMETSDGAWATFYAHLDQILVRQGQTIAQGETLGLMGRTGRATGVHLHFEIRHHKKALDPLPLLPRSMAEQNPASRYSRQSLWQLGMRLINPFLLG